MAKKLLRLVFIIAAFLFSGAYATTYAIPKGNDDSKEYEPAQFPGGQDAVDKWLEKYVIYPEEELKLGIEETIVVGFTITPEGEIKYPYIIEGENENLMEAALKAMEHMPNWKPGKRFGVPIETKIAFEIEFYIKQRIHQQDPLPLQLNRRY